MIVSVDVTVIVVANVIVAALGNGNANGDVIDTVSDVGASDRNAGRRGRI